MLCPPRVLLCAHRDWLGRAIRLIPRLPHQREGRQQRTKGCLTSVRVWVSSVVCATLQNLEQSHFKCGYSSQSLLSWCMHPVRFRGRGNLHREALTQLRNHCCWCLALMRIIDTRDRPHGLEERRHWIVVLSWLLWFDLPPCAFFGVPFYMWAG